MAEDLTAWCRFSYLRSTIANWPLVGPDKLGLVRDCPYRTRSGLTVWCRGRSTDVNEAVAVLSGHEYPPEFLRVGNGSVVIDLGANIGSFALYIAGLNRATTFRGVAFEPFPPNFALLRRNLEQNGISTFDAVQAAVTDVDGLVRLASGREPDRVHVSGLAEEGDPESATSYRLSSYCRANGITSVDLLKMDVEGAEYGIVAADGEFLRTSVANVLVEYHELGGNRTAGRLLERLRDDFVLTVVHEHSRTGVIHARNARL